MIRCLILITLSLLLPKRILYSALNSIMKGNQNNRGIAIKRYKIIYFFMKLKIKQESNSSSKAGTQAMGEAGWCAD